MKIPGRVVFCCFVVDLLEPYVSRLSKSVMTNSFERGCLCRCGYGSRCPVFLRFETPTYRVKRFDEDFAIALSCLEHVAQNARKAPPATKTVPRASASPE